MNKIYVYDDCGEIVSKVNYNDNLDFWDGSNWSCGSIGRHKGLTKLRNGKYVLIHGTNWQGEKDSAELISDYQAYLEIVNSGNTELFESGRFKDLHKFEDKLIEKELEEDYD